MLSHFSKKVASFFFISLIACGPLFAQDGLRGVIHSLTSDEPLTTNVRDTEGDIPYLDGFKPLSFSLIPLLDQNKGKQYIIPPGTYAGVFESFCLRAGTYAPTKGNGYVSAPFKGSKGKLIARLLQKASERPNVPQRDVQELLWAIIARTDLTKSPKLKATLNALLANRQGLIDFSDTLTLQGGILQFIPESDLGKALGKVDAALAPVYKAENEIRKLAVQGESYETLERLAVLEGTPPPHKDDRTIPGGRWIYSPSGLFMRYAPSGYQRTRIDVYSPERFLIATDNAGRISEIVALDDLYRIEVTYKSTATSASSALQAHELGSLKLFYANAVITEGALSGQILTGIPSNSNTPGIGQTVYQNAVAHYGDVQNIRKQFIKDKKERKYTDLVVNLTHFKDGITEALNSSHNEESKKVLYDFLCRAWASTIYQWATENENGTLIEKFTYGQQKTFQLASLGRFAFQVAASPPGDISIVGSPPFSNYPQGQRQQILNDLYKSSHSTLDISEEDKQKLLLSLSKTPSGLPLAMMGMMVSGDANRQRLGVSMSRIDGEATSSVENKKQSSAGNMQKQVERGQAPKSVDRVDKGRGPYEKDHIEFDDGNALNSDGKWKHGGRPLTNDETRWIQDNGWSLPK